MRNRLFPALMVGVLAVAFMVAPVWANTKKTTEVMPAIRVAAASDMKFAFDELLQLYKKDHPGVNVEVTYGSSGNFYAQLESQAPFDLFLSADYAYPQKLAEKGLGIQESQFLYAIGRIVVWQPQSGKLDLAKLGMRALLEPSVRKVAIANPAHAPYGKAAVEAMKKLGVYAQVEPRLVLGDNIAQTAQFVESGGADIGIIALSLAVAPAMREKGTYWEVPLDAYPLMEQGGVILSWTKQMGEVRGLRAFLLGEQGKAVLKKYGFFLPEGKTDWISQR